jgi:hypothetical protein
MIKSHEKDNKVSSNTFLQQWFKSEETLEVEVIYKRFRLGCIIQISVKS